MQQPQANEPWTVPTALACRPAGRVVAGCMLHMLRRAARLKRGDVAAAAGVSDPAIAALEAGAGHAHPALIDELLRRYGPHAIEHAAGLARLVDDEEDTQALGTVMDLLPGWRERLAAVYGLATSVQASADQTFPPYLWVPAYAAARRQPERVAHPVRATVLSVVSERALHFPGVPRSIVVQQLTHIQQLITGGRAALQIVPMQAGAAIADVAEVHVCGSALLVTEFPLTGVAYNSDPKLVAEFRSQRQEAARWALSAQVSTQVLADTLAHYTRDPSKPHVPRLGVTPAGEAVVIRPG